MSAIARVRAYLDNIAPELQIIELETDTSTSELAASALDLAVGQIAKTLLFKSKQGFFMIVAAGDARMDFKAVKELAGGRVRMATSEECLDVTGYPVGGVCPFALPQPLPVYLDKSLLRFEVVYAAAGTPNSALPITYRQLTEVTGGTPCAVSMIQETR